MALEGAQAPKTLRNDTHAEMSLAFARARMAGMEMALIDDLELDWAEGLFQECADSLDALGVSRLLVRILSRSRHGVRQRLSSLAASLWERRTAIQIAWVTAVKTVNPIVPAVLKMTHVSMS